MLQEPGAIEWPLPPLPVPKPPSPKELRAVSLSFKLDTTEPDGFHPRHFAMLSDGALRVLGGLYAVMEQA
eukprot:4781207-Lingulodinium_polyedra.AAC.1